MGLSTGTTQTTTAPGNTAGQQLQQSQIGGALGASPLSGFATPNSLYTLTPAEQTFQGLGMGLSLPGAEANRALSYANSSPFQSYFRNFIAPTVQNNAIASGYGGASGASMEALSRAGEQAAMSGLTNFGMPMAAQDRANVGQGLNYAGLQRTTSISDLSRIQNLLQSLTGMLPTSVPGGTTTTSGPGAASMLLNGLGSLGMAALNGGNGGFANSLVGSLPWSSLKNLFSGSTADPSTTAATDSGTASNFWSATAPDATAPMITDSGVMDPQTAQMDAWLSSSGG